MDEGLIVPVRDRRRRVVILAALWLFVALVLVAFRSVVMFFAGAALIAYLVAPLVDRLTHLPIGKRRLPRWTAILLIYLGFFTAVTLASIALVPQLYREVARISRDAVAWSNTLTPERVRQISEDLEDWLTARGLPVEISSRALEGAADEEAEPLEWTPEAERPQFSLSVDLEEVLQNSIGKVGGFARDNFGDIVGVSRKVITGVLAGVFALFFILMVAAFFSIDTRTIRRYVTTLVPPEHAGDVVTLAKMIDRKLAGVVRGQITICLINGALTFIGLLLLGVKFAFLLATLATVLSLIPIFGTIVSSVPIVAIGLSQDWKTGLGALLWIVGIHALEAYFLNPKIMGTAARIHPIVIAFALIAGERTYGLAGAFFAVPLAAVVVACFDFFRLKAQPPAAPPAAIASER